MMASNNPVVHLEAWRGDMFMPFFWIASEFPDRPARYKTREVFVGKRVTITVWSYDILSRAECLTIATAEATGKCRKIDLRKI
jgi:hypothetical protein